MGSEFDGRQDGLREITCSRVGETLISAFSNLNISKLAGESDLSKV